MFAVPSYERPPVREALIDIRVNRLPAEKLPALEKLHEALRAQYPHKRPQQTWEGKFEFREDALLSAQKAYGITGFHFESDDKKRIIQYRLDGFTCNFLKPDPKERWPGWEALRDEAKRAWELYANSVGIVEVKRLAVRYINQIVIPAPIVELSDYLTAPPSAPKDCKYQDFRDFLSRVTLDIPELNAIAIVTQAPAQEMQPDSVHLLLDIDVIRAEALPAHTEAMWRILERFRDIKNEVFEKSLHQKAKDLFGPLQ
ncbi:MAG: TIGR04255 family protein [Nitrospirota bacterium]